METAFLLLVALSVGSSLGSFVGLCADRIPKGLAVILPPSHCSSCCRLLRWYELIPIVSFLALKGKCSGCSAKIPRSAFVAEISGAGIGVYCLVAATSPMDALKMATIDYLMLLIALTDWNHLLIPDKAIGFGIIAGLVFHATLGLDGVLPAILAGAISLTIMGAIRHLGRVIFKTEAMGMGDVKLGGMIGIFVGVEVFLFVLWFSSVLGAIYGLALARSDGSRSESLPGDGRGSSWAGRGGVIFRTVSRSEPLPFGSILAAVTIFAVPFQSSIEEIFASLFP